MPDMDFLANLNNPAMYASMIFFTVCIIGVVMALKTRIFRLHQLKTWDYRKGKQPSDELRDVLDDERRMRERMNQSNNPAWSQKEPNWETIRPSRTNPEQPKKNNVDDLLKTLEEDVKKEGKEENKDE